MIDMATVLDPADPFVASTAAEARATMVELGARPLIELGARPSTERASEAACFRHDVSIRLAHLPAR